MSDAADHRPHTAPSVLAFHKVSSRRSYGVTNYSPSRLGRLLEHFKTEGLLSSILLTFDDGYSHLTDVLPSLIETFGIRPIIFMPTAWIGLSNRWDYSYALRKEPHLDREAIADLARLGVEFGSHGHTHHCLTERTPEELRRELTESGQILEDITNRPVRLLSYPFGRSNAMVREAALACGYETAYGMHFPAPEDSVLNLGRFAVYAYDSLSMVRAKLQGRGAVFQLCRSASALSNRLAGGTILLNRLRGLSAHPD